MKLIDRYVWAVVEHLPEDIREDVSRELHTNIEDMLPENPSEKDVRRVLEELGNPWILANEYNTKKRYLIGPRFYEQYISVLKLVVGIVTTVLVSLNLLGWVLDLANDGFLVENLIELFVKLLVTGIQGGVQAALWVTLVFAVLERSGVEEGQIPFTKKKWSLDDLPTLPEYNKSKISKGETVFSMFCTILFTSLIYFQPQLIALYMKDDYGITHVTSLFDIQRLQSYMVVIIVLAIIQLGILIWKFIARNWNISLAIANASYNVGFCILVILMVRDHSLFNQKFFSTIADLMKISLSQIALVWDRSIWIFAAVFIIICIWDSIAAFRKCKKENKKSLSNKVG